MKRKLPVIAVTVLLIQSIGLFYCGDKDCLLDESDEICKISICSSLYNYGQLQQPSESNQDGCSQCACCLSYNLPDFNGLSTTFAVSYVFLEPRLFISRYVSPIDHIPRA